MRKIQLIIFISLSLNLFSCSSFNRENQFRKQEYQTATKQFSYQVISTQELENWLLGGIEEPSIECELKNFKKAKQYFLKNYVRGSEKINYWIKSAVCNFEEGKKGLSLYQLKRAQEKFREEPNPNLEINLAIYFHKLKNYSLAYNQYLKAEKLQSDNLLLRINFARLLLKIGYIDEALNRVQGIYQIAAYDSEVLFILGTILTLSGKNDLALKTFDQIESDQLQRRDIAVSYAIALYLDGQKSEALSVLENSVKSSNSQLEKRYKRILSNLKS